MKIAVGADHRGFEKKSNLKRVLLGSRHEVLDVGTDRADAPCDYPEIAWRVGQAVSSRQADLGILVCMSGIGMSIAANKIKGIRAALVHDTASAQLSRSHNDANVLVIGSDDVREPLEQIVKTWISTPFQGGRHQRRIDQIRAIEEKELS